MTKNVVFGSAVGATMPMRAMVHSSCVERGQAVCRFAIFSVAYRGTLILGRSVLRLRLYLEYALSTPSQHISRSAVVGLSAVVTQNVVPRAAMASEPERVIARQPIN
ncbi:hypothetical protein B0E49_17855 [Polaromonas sp. C04]|nr:hypothetical protein B0E49_17855 [Polaromonas sp. C04]